jgi:hypothetical protein
VQNGLICQSRPKLTGKGGFGLSGSFFGHFSVFCWQNYQRLSWSGYLVEEAKEKSQLLSLLEEALQRQFPDYFQACISN